MELDIISPEIKEKLEQLTKEIVEIKKNLRIGTGSLTPLNYMEEMEKFFKSSAYNPKYVYKKQKLNGTPKKIDILKIKVDQLKLPQDLKDYMLDYLDDQKKLFLTKNSIGKNEFSDHAHALFDWGTDRLDLLLSNTPKVKFKLFIKHNMQDADIIKERFEKILDNYRIGSFKVKIDSFSPHIINVGYKSISVGSDIKRFECNVDRLVVHEIESHVLQTENIKNSTTALTELSKYGITNLYSEGLAIYNEVITRKITPSAFETYLFRIKAVRLLNKSFRDIYEILREDLPQQKAFVMTYRVKRGLSDTSNPGGYPKDAAYLLGLHEIESLISEKFPKDLLYATKSPMLSNLLIKYNLIDTKKVITPKF